MGKAELAAPIRHLGEAGEFRSVIHGNHLKDFRESASVFVLGLLQCTQLESRALA